MPVSKSSSHFSGMKSESSAYSINFQTTQDNRGPVLKIFASYADDVSLNPGSEYNLYDDPQLSLSHWLTPSLSEMGSCEPEFQPPSLMASCNPYETSYVPFDENFDNNNTFWPYDQSNYLNPLLASLNATGSMNPASPSMSSISSSSFSDDRAASPPPPLNEFANIFDFNFLTSLQNDASTSSWSRTFPSTFPSRSGVASPSPSCSSTDHCDTKSASSRDSSPSHSESDLSRQRRRFPCLIIGCDRRFTSQYTLKVHMEAHKPKPRVSFPCTLGCTERFSRQHDRLRHEVAKHGKVCEFSCEECGRFFSTKKTLGNHKCPVAQGGTRWVNN
ncbi:hypothetical protein BDQ12DRAFT_265457 [Crucibulum laeve]|uniref:C2H2-type domain-containing protein n=1 Tax=Crucibulum laeve TaxID=68775 RepID=A0A5C3M423_9AGAR|nr:hypothetical protein BDQ12DRAFT_265457 [Crucibulum laeve]